MDEILRKRPNPGLPYAIVALALVLFVVLKFILTIVFAAQTQSSELWRAEKARHESKLSTEDCRPTENFSKDVKDHSLYSGETTYSPRRQYLCEDGTVAWKTID